MSDYSPQAQELLEQWKCLSLNMRTTILRARWLQQKANDLGHHAQLNSQLQEKKVNALYREIGRQMRAFSMTDGVEKEIPEDPFMGPNGIGRFVDFRIHEEAIPELRSRLEKLSDLVLTLLITLCTIHP